MSSRTKQAHKILGVSSHIVFPEHELLSSGRRWRTSKYTCTKSSWPWISFRHQSLFWMSDLQWSTFLISPIYYCWHFVSSSFLFYRLESYSYTSRLYPLSVHVFLTWCYNCGQYEESVNICVYICICFNDLWIHGVQKSIRIVVADASRMSTAYFSAAKIKFILILTDLMQQTTRNYIDPVTSFHVSWRFKKC